MLEIKKSLCKFPHPGFMAMVSDIHNVFTGYTTALYNVEKNLSKLKDDISLIEGYFLEKDKVQKNIHKFGTHQNLEGCNKTLSISSTDSSTESFDENFIFLKKKRPSKKCTNCPHKNAKHYAKNMCANCYHSRGREKKPWKCPHYSRGHYALGLCQNCYHSNYIKSKKYSKV